MRIKEDIIVKKVWLEDTIEDYDEGDGDRDGGGSWSWKCF